MRFSDWQAIKAALGTILLGGGAAVTAGQIAAKSTLDELHSHINIIHPVLAQQVADVKKSADQAAYNALVARINTEALLRGQGIAIPKPPPKPDAGE